MSNDFITSPDERLIWQGRPVFWPYIRHGIIDSLDSVKFLAYVWVVAFAYSWVGNYEHSRAAGYLFTLIILGHVLLKLGRKYFDFKATTYYLTNWRLVIVNNNKTEPIKSLDKNLIKSVDVTVSNTEGKYNTGTILIDMGEVRYYDGQEEKVLYRLEAIPEPERVLRMF